jgi:hypothetical protein
VLADLRRQALERRQVRAIGLANLQRHHPGRQLREAGRLAAVALRHRVASSLASCRL